MNKILSIKLFFTLITATLLGCIYSHTDFVKVEPSKRIQNTENGWISVSEDQAQGYKVRVGDLTYQRIIEPHKVNGEIDLETALSAFASFAEKQVVRMEYCNTAVVPESSRKLVGSNSPPEMWIYVVCKS